MERDPNSAADASSTSEISDGEPVDYWEGES